MSKKIERNKKNEKMKDKTKALMVKVLMVVCAIVFIIIVFIFACKTGSITSQINKFNDTPFLKDIPVPTTFTFWVFIGIISILCHIIKHKHKIFGGNIKELDNEALKFYYSKLLEALMIVFTGFIIGLSILWSTPRADILILQAQSILMALLLMYTYGCLYITIIKDFKNEFKNRHKKTKTEKIIEVIRRHDRNPNDSFFQTKKGKEIAKKIQETNKIMDEK